MATKKNPDHMHLCVVSDVMVSEKAYRDWCTTQGVDLTGVVVSAHAAKEIREIVLAALTARGVLVPTT